MNSGDTAWMLAATALVMIMLPGLALFYGGLVRRKNVLSTIMHSFFGLAIVSVVWVLIGFSLAFGKDANLFGIPGLVGNYLAFIAYQAAKATGSHYAALTLHGVPHVAIFVGLGRETWRILQEAVEETNR